MCAASKGSAQLIEYLLKRNVDVNLKSKDGNSSLLFAAQSGDFNSFKALYDRPTVDKTCKNTEEQNTFVSTAAYSSKTIVKFLLDQPETNVNERDHIGMNSLILAAQKGNLPTFQTLLCSICRLRLVVPVTICRST